MTSIVADAVGSGVWLTISRRSLCIDNMTHSVRTVGAPVCSVGLGCEILKENKYQKAIEQMILVDELSSKKLCRVTGWSSKPLGDSQSSDTESGQSQVQDISDIHLRIAWNGELK